MIFNVAAPPDVLLIWAIYEYPTEYVTVAHYVLDDAFVGQAPPVHGFTLPQLRAEFRRNGYICLAAGIDEHPILETWL